MIGRRLTIRIVIGAAAVDFGTAVGVAIDLPGHPGHQVVGEGAAQRRARKTAALRRKLATSMS